MTEAIPLQATSSYVKPKTENLHNVRIDPEFPDWITFIEAHQTSPLRKEIISALMENRNCFAWSYVDVTGIDPSIITHQLQVDPNFTPIM